MFNTIIEEWICLVAFCCNEGFIQALFYHQNYIGMSFEIFLHNCIFHKCNFGDVVITVIN